MEDILKQYHEHLALIMGTGYKQGNRTDQWAITLPYGVTHTYDLADGFPAIWSKQLYFPGIRGDLGKVYGYQWRYWEGADGRMIDQVQVALDTIRNDPYSRRIVISAWRPDHFSQMALPPCHVIYRFQVNVEAGELNMSVYQRSSDMFLGVPMNIAGAAIMLELFAAATGLTPRWLTHHLDDTHVYSKAFSAVEEQLRIVDQNEPPSPPILRIHTNLRDLDANGLAAIKPEDITMEGYQAYTLASERVPMATTRKP